MSNNPAFDFSVDKENKTITVKREFAAARALVWEAYTKSEILDQWWGPKPWKARTKSMDFKEGGRWHYAMVGPAGEEHWAVSNFKSIDPQKSFTAHDAFADAEGNIIDAFADAGGNMNNNNAPQSKWQVSFKDQGEKTLVEIRISYDDLAHLEGMLKMAFKEGLGMGMDQLDELLPSLKK